MEKFQQPIMRRDDIFKERERKEREERERKERERLLINDGSDLWNEVLAMMEQEKKNASNSSSPPGKENVE